MLWTNRRTCADLICVCHPFLFPIAFIPIGDATEVYKTILTSYPLNRLWANVWRGNFSKSFDWHLIFNWRRPKNWTVRPSGFLVWYKCRPKLFLNSGDNLRPRFIWLSRKVCAVLIAWNHSTRTKISRMICSPIWFCLNAEPYNWRYSKSCLKSHTFRFNSLWLWYFIPFRHSILLIE